MGWQEKRRFPRINFRAPLRYQIAGGSSYGDCLSNNISAGGLSFVSNNFMAPNTSLLIEINILSRPLSPLARIAWSYPLPRSDRNRIGVEFTEFDPQEKDYLNDFIKMKIGEHQ